MKTEGHIAQWIIIWGVFLSALSGISAPVPIIFDTDMSGDCDDAGALAILHVLADRGECTILGVVTDDPNGDSGKTVDIINTFYGRGDIPIGLLAETKPNGWQYPAVISKEFPHDFHNADAPEAVALYRRLLAAAEDRSIVIVSVGFLPNLARLLKSLPDASSPLRGSDLVHQKVKMLVAMAGKFPKGREYNVYNYAADEAGYVLQNWSAPVVYSGFEIGEHIATGLRLWTETKADNPVRRCYELYLKWNVTEQKSRPSWDPTAVLFAVRGAGNWWQLNNTGHVVYNPADQSTIWVDTPDPDGRADQAYLVEKAPREAIAKEIDDLMVTPPKPR